jgi:hypothetical protein
MRKTLAVAFEQSTGVKAAVHASPSNLSLSAEEPIASRRCSNPSALQTHQGLTEKRVVAVKR